MLQSIVFFNKFSLKGLTLNLTDKAEKSFTNPEKFPKITTSSYKYLLTVSHYDLIYLSKYCTIE